MKNLYFLWIGLFLSMAGMNAAIPFFPLYVRELGVIDSEEVAYWSGLIQAGPFFISIITVPIWGTLGDKYGRKLMTVRAGLGLAFFTLLMGFSRNVVDLFILRVLQGAFAGFVAASLSLIAYCTPRERSGYAIGVLQTAMSVGAIVGPLMGGFIADIYGMRPVLFIVAGLCLAGAIVVAIGVVDPSKTTQSSQLQSTIKNFSYVFSSSNLLMIVGFIAMLQMAMSFVQPIFPQYVESLHAPTARLATITGVLTGLAGICNAIFAPIWGRRGDALGFEKTLSFALPLVMLAFVGQGLVNNYIYLFPFRILIGICAAALVPTLYAAIAKQTPQEKISGAMGVASSAHLFGNLMGPLACGWIVAHVGMRWCFFCAGALALLVNLILRFRKNFELRTAAPNS